MIFFEGYLIGLGTIIFIGPVVFTLLQITLDKGFIGGFYTALGILVSDIVTIIVCEFGAVPFLKDVTNQLWISVFCAALLIFIGIKYILSPDVRVDNYKPISNLHYLGAFSKGFLINFVNPTVFLYWIGFLSYAQNSITTSFNGKIFILGILSGIFSIDLTKTLLAHKLKPYIKPKLLKNIYQGIGLTLIVFGIGILWLAY